MLAAAVAKHGSTHFCCNSVWLLSIEVPLLAANPGRSICVSKPMKIFYLSFPKLLLSFVLAFGLGLTTLADGVDPTFNANVQTTTFLGKRVSKLISLPDGKTIAAGDFNNYNGTATGRVIRLNSDATLDPTFNNNNELPFVYGGFQGMEVSPDGSVLIWGNTTWSQPYEFAVIRLSSEGNVVPGFTYPFPSSLEHAVFDQAGRIIVYGNLERTIYGQITRSIARLNNDGTIDQSFGTSTADIRKAAISEDKIYCVATDQALGQTIVFRLNENGSHDATFPVTPIGNFLIFDIKVQADGKILIHSVNKIYRLNQDGTADQGFQILTFLPQEVHQMFLSSDGRITTVRNLSSPYGTKFERFLANGSPDPAYSSYFVPGDPIASATQHADGSVLIGDSGNTGSNQFTKLLPSGLRDPSFHPGSSGFQRTSPGKIRSIAALQNGQILIAGDFGKVNDQIRTRIARINEDSTLDPSFQINVGGSGNVFSEVKDVYHVFVQADGKYVVSGHFTYNVSGASKQHLVRLNPDGSIDPTFVLSESINDHYISTFIGSNKPVRTIDGKIIIGTTRPSFSDTRSVPLALDSSGHKDPTFTATLFADRDILSIYDIAAQDDGKLLISGIHVLSNIAGNQSRGFVARLNSNGSLDSTFQVFETADRIIPSFSVLPHGRILAISQSPTNSNVIRLNNDGTLDQSFNSGIAANGKINSIASKPDGSMLVGGVFSTYGGVSRHNLALLTSNGDLGSDPGSANQEVLCIAVDSKGRTMIGGLFTSVAYMNQEANISYLARFEPSSDLASVSGRVSTPNGLGLRNASVIIVDSDNNKLVTTTSSFGNYLFENIRSNETYTLSVASKRYRFASRILQVDGNLANVDMIGLE
jgi:uncharacterized delta-60 repeat protein